jgi:hypothetical protein
MEVTARPGYPAGRDAHTSGANSASETLSGDVRPHCAANRAGWRQTSAVTRPPHVLRSPALTPCTAAWQVRRSALWAAGAASVLALVLLVLATDSIARGVHDPRTVLADAPLTTDYLEGRSTTRVARGRHAAHRAAKSTTTTPPAPVPGVKEDRVLKNRKDEKLVPLESSSLASSLALPVRPRRQAPARRRPVPGHRRCRGSALTRGGGGRGGRAGEVGAPRAVPREPDGARAHEAPRLRGLAPPRPAPPRLAPPRLVRRVEQKYQKLSGRAIACASGAPLVRRIIKNFPVCRRAP